MTAHPALVRARDRLAAEVAGPGRLGVQLYVSVDGEPLERLAVGEYRPGEPLTPDHPLPWLCACKPVTVLALAQLYDGGELTTGLRVADVIPGFAAGGKRDVTLEHLLTHTVLYAGEGEPYLLDWAGAVDAICRWRITAPPGEVASYSGFASWLVLAEVVRRVTGQDFYSYVRKNVLDPLGMHACTYYESPGEQLPAGVLFERDPAGALRPLHRLGARETTGWPGGGLWGPIHELARPLECAVGGGEWRGNRLVSAAAVEHFFTTCRVDIEDQFFAGLDVTWGRGVCTDPAWFGAPGGARVAGMDGLQLSLVVGDLDTRLVVAYATNTIVAGAPMFRRLENLVVGDLYDLVR
jgi:CubicO group peptidase (beta-lactamase class C family)